MNRNFIKAGILSLMIGLSGTATGSPVLFENNYGITVDASPVLDVKIYPRAKGLIAVNFKKQLNETVIVKIFTLNGTRIFKEKITTHELVAKRYDMTRFPDGQYIIEVSNENYLVRQVVKKKN